MVVLENEALAKYTTMKIGGIAKQFYIPESEDELLKLVKEIGQEHILILSGGSNLLINDKKSFEHVVYTKELDNRIIDKGNGIAETQGKKIFPGFVIPGRNAVEALAVAFNNGKLICARP